MRLLFQRCHQFVEAIHCGLQVLDNISCQHIGIGQAIKVCQGLVFDPEDIQAGLIPLQDFFNAEFAPTAIGILLGPSFGALMPVLRVIALNEIQQICICHRILLQCEVDIGSEIINPDIL